MAYVDLLCLANSYKRGGWCVAGLRIDGQGWVRPVAPDTSFGQLYGKHIRLTDGSDPQILDVIGVDLDRPQPHPGQPENWAIGSDPWVLRKRSGGDGFEPLLRAALAQRGSLLLGSEGRSVAEEDAARATASLALVAPSALQWSLERSDRPEDRPQPRVLIRLSGREYVLPVTDPIWSLRIVRQLTSMEPGWHPRETLGVSASDRVLLTISLSEPFHGRCYKLAAGIAVLPAR